MNGSKGFRKPTRDEIFNLMTGTLFILDSETIFSYESGIRSSFLKFFELNENVFYMIVKNEIIGSALFFPPNKNFEEVMHKGIESRVNITPFNILQGNISHTYQKIYFSKGEYKGKIVPLSPENLFSAAISIFPLKGIMLSHISRWRDKCYTANDIENKYDGLKPFWVSDLKIAYKNEKIKTEFIIYNLYNENYSEFAGLDWMNKIGFYPSPRRNFELSINFYF